MELEKRDLSFQKMNEVVLTTLESKKICLGQSQRNALTTIGTYYFRFLDSENTNLALKAPFFDEKMKELAIEYIYYFDFLFKVVNLDRKHPYVETALFDIFSYLNSDRIFKEKKQFVLRFKQKIKNAFLFEKDTVVSQNRFLPLFKVDKVGSLSYRKKEAVTDVFHLFKNISRTKILNYPVLIDFENNISLFVGKSFSFNPPKLISENVASAKIKTDNELEKLLDSFDKKDIQNTIFYKYPYHNNIDSRIYLEFSGRVKQFELTLRKRLFYDKIQEDDLILIPNEFDEEVVPSILKLLKSYYVVQTNHDCNIYSHLGPLKKDWHLAGFNIYKTPFPGNWLMCVHKGEGLDFWKEQFRKDFPAVHGILLEEVLKLIELIYNLDWIGNYLPNINATTVLVQKSIAFSEVTNSFKNYIENKFTRLVDIDTLLTLGVADNEEIIVLDPFNTVMLTNLAIRCQRGNFKVVVPDFLYFNYQPFIKYFIAKYFFSALLGGARSWIDAKYQMNLKVWEEEKASLISKIKKEITAYERRYDLEKELVEPTEEELDKDKFPDELTEDEVVEVASDEEQQVNEASSSYEIHVTTTDGKSVILRSRSRVLIKKRGFVINTVASLLRKGVSFLPLSEISKTLDKSLLVEKMASMPDNAKDWKFQLFKKKTRTPKVFSFLKKQGLSVKEMTFEKDYLSETTVDGSEVHLPRSKRDWEIVCDVLNIKEVGEAWRINKCRGDLNRLKKAYAEIIEYLIEESIYGVNVSDEELEEVANIYLSITGLEEDKEERLKDAKSIISSITNELQFFEVRSLNTFDV